VQVIKAHDEWKYNTILHAPAASQQEKHKWVSPKARLDDLENSKHVPTAAQPDACPCTDYATSAPRDNKHT
jgi:hypothetical protein